MDEGRKQTDLLLAEMEKKIKKEYKQASQEVEDKLNQYLQSFADKDAKKQSQLNHGLITQQEYDQWRINQMLIGQRWSDMRDNLTQDYLNADKIAKSIVNGYMPEVYALNHNYGTYDVEHKSKIDTSYTLYDRQTVERLMRDNPKMLPPPGRKVSQAIAEGRAKRWNNQHIQSVMMQSLLQGESIPKIANRLAEKVGDSNYKAAIRNARTMTTRAENYGRLDSYKRAQNMGIKMQKQWVATLDQVTRDSHVDLDGETVDVNENFSNGMDCPGGMGPPEEVYNCRCTMVAQIKGFETDASDLSLRNTDKLGDMSYDEWKEAHQNTQNNGIIYTPYNLQRPVRPSKSNFTNIDDYYTARTLYREQLNEYERLREKWILENTPLHSMTADEIQAWCDDKDIKIYNDISPVDGRALTAYTQRMDKLSSEFPEVMKYRELLDIPKQYTKYELAYENTSDFIAEATHGFTFGESGRSVTDIMRQRCDQISQGIMVEGAGPLNSLFDHEFGHNVYSYIMAKENVTRFEIEQDVVKALQGKNGISEYAFTNDHEMFAEGFAAWYGGEKTEFANAMGDLLRRWGVI